MSTKGGTTDETTRSYPVRRDQPLARIENDMNESNVKRLTRDDHKCRLQTGASVYMWRKTLNHCASVDRDVRFMLSSLFLVHSCSVRTNEVACVGTRTGKLCAMLKLLSRMYASSYAAPVVNQGVASVHRRAVQS